jgi:hypothetical protein
MAGSEGAQRMTETPAELIELLITHEEMMAAFYLLLSERFDEDSDFWWQLSQEEKGHVVLLRSMGHDMEEGAMLFDRQRLDRAAIRTSIEYTRSVMSFAVKQPLTPLNAASMAIDLEESLIELGMYKLFQGRTPDAKQHLLAYEKTFTEHAARIHQFRQQKSGTSGGAAGGKIS